MSGFTGVWRMLLIAAVAATGFTGCGSDEDNPANNSGGGSYETVPIGGNKWMKKNLNVKTDDSWCYNNSADSCKKYGRLYTWNAAKKACQSVGMRLPTNDEWDDLVTAAGGVRDASSKLKSKKGWDGMYSDGNSNTDEFGFSALPGGMCAPVPDNMADLFPDMFPDGILFIGVVELGHWWTATEDSDENAYNRRMGSGSFWVEEFSYPKNSGLSVRCVAN